MGKSSSHQVNGLAADLECWSAQKRREWKSLELVWCRFQQLDEWLALMMKLEPGKKLLSVCTLVSNQVKRNASAGYKLDAFE